MADFFRFVVVQHWPDSDDSKYGYGAADVIALDEADAMSRGGPAALFAVRMDVMPNDWGHYDYFGPWCAEQLAVRGLPISTYYREHYLSAGYRPMHKVATKKKVVGPRKPPPEVPPPVWDMRPINADAAMAAVRSSCESYRSS